MKKHDIPSLLTNTLLVILLTGGSMGAMISGLSLRVDANQLIFACIFWAAGACLCWQLRRGGWILLAVTVLYVALLSGNGLGRSLQNLHAILGKTYYNAYSWDIDDVFAQMSAKVLTKNVTLACISILLASNFLTSWVLCRRKMLVFCLPALFIPLGLTLVANDTVPDGRWIFLLLCGLALLFLSQATRRMDSRQGARLVALLLAPVILISGLFLKNNPERGYQVPDFRRGLLAYLYEQIQQIPFGSHGGIPGEDLGIVNLNLIGPRDPSSTYVMDMTVNYGGMIYLRGRSYSLYTGTSWSEKDNAPQEYFRLDPQYLMVGINSDNPADWDGDVFRLTLSGAQNDPLKYLPYYPAYALELKNGALERANGETEYSYYVNPLRSDWKTLWRQAHTGYSIGKASFSGMDAYLSLPEETMQGAAAILKLIGISSSTLYADASNRIADYVRASASYSLNTAAMPAEEEDFVLWFLNRSTSGYCVHFASAAVVLLRAAGIPARYVEGYAVRAPGETTPLAAGTSRSVPITADRAHAWAEYYVPDVGWVILDATPNSSSITPPPTTQPTVPTVPTSPSTSTLPTLTTRPTLSTDPSTSTATEPTQPVPTESTPPDSTPTDNPSAGSTPAATVPDSGSLPGGTGSLAKGLPPAFWIALAAISAAIGALLLQWQLRLRLRIKRLRQKDPNGRALAGWAYACLLARLQKMQPPEQLQALALKAKFSQHTLSSEELDAFDVYFAQSIASLYQQPWYKRLWYRLIRVAY